MWENAEAVSLVDDKGVIRAVSRNEEEDPIREAVGKDILYRVVPESVQAVQEAFAATQRGEEVELMVATRADAGYVYWNRVVAKPSPEDDGWVLVHTRRLPRSWGELSERERDVVGALHTCGMNPKRAARELGISVNTLNAHRRSICQKCRLNGVGDFWVFVEQCR